MSGLHRLDRGRARGSLPRAVVAMSAALAAALGGGAVASATPITSPGGGESFNISPGDSFRVGYDFKVSGSHGPIVVRWTDPKAVVNFTCDNGSTGSFTIPMPDYTTTLTDSDWVPSGDQHSPLVYQGSISAPDGCGDGSKMHQKKIATFTADVTSDPAGAKISYRFHDVNNDASGSWSSTESVTGGPITQTLRSEIYTCVQGAPSTSLAPGGSIAVPAASLSSANPLSATQVPAATYTVNATAPSGYQFVACGQTGVTIPSPGSASQNVTVPTGGSGDGKFYVQPIPAPVQTIQSEIYRCVTGAPTTTLVPGGSISVPAAGLSATDQLAATQVPAATYQVDASAPSGFKFVPCGQPGVTIPPGGASASQSVVVPSGGAGDGVFYVIPIPAPVQTIQAEIYECLSGAPSTSLVSGGSLDVPAASLSSANPLAATNVAAATYTVNATAPASYQFVPCGQTGVTITSPGSANQDVVVPSGGAGDGVFYVEAVPPPVQTIQAEIYQCINGAPSTTLASGGSLAVPSASLSSPNPLAPTQVPDGTYQVNATAPAGYQFVACGQTGVTIPSPGSANQSVVVPPGGSGDGPFYVEAIPPKTGYIEICKSTENGVSGTFAFVVNGATVTVPAGSCSSAIEVPVGSLTVKEKVTTGYAMAGASTYPSARLQSVNLTNQVARVQVVAGDVSTQTIVMFVNKPVQGTIKVCQVAGDGIPVGTPFTFTNSANSYTVTVPAGPAPGGYCAVLGTDFTGAQQVTVTQQIPAGDKVTSIKVAPFNRFVSRQGYLGKVTVTVGSGVTEVTFTDAVK